MLVFIALALAVSPMRGLLAESLPTAAGDTTHCDQMQMAMPATEHRAGMLDSTADTQGHGCNQDCGGDCCDSACNSCAHTTIAICGTLMITSDQHYATLNVIAFHGISGRTIHPPFRPPISLPS